ncbi:MAG: VTC domain-containing protein [Candidatus Marinimicrobia bacterium]|nr:VTC domain-containing protein [Candidatus Neomarinimicrobiota bacterium]|tara:strand:+ start:2546 stop:3301 length:756 start_codon:yes stop_codon:yes gene_type:complete
MDYLTLLKKFEAVSLKDLDSVQLLNRHDTKFVFNVENLTTILTNLLPSYKILKINEDLIFDYNNDYFDTSDFIFYTQHHNENRNRFKIRYRNYKSTNTTFFEIKTKNNKNRTVKQRIKSEKISNTFNKDEEELINSVTGVNPSSLLKSINIKFSRITLVDNNFTERLTIDTNVNVLNNKNKKIFNKLIIAEIKQSKFNPKSYFIKCLKSQSITRMKFSKYCMGLIHLNPELKVNRFKPKLKILNKIISQEN